MTWREYVVAAIGLGYAAVGLGYLVTGQKGFGVLYLAYATANVGLIVAAIEGS